MRGSLRKYLFSPNQTSSTPQVLYSPGIFCCDPGVYLYPLLTSINRCPNLYPIKLQRYAKYQGRNIVPWNVHKGSINTNIFFYGHTCSTCKFLGQGLNLSHSCNLHHGCSNAGSFYPLRRARDQTWASAATWAPEVGFLMHYNRAVTPTQISF